MPSRIKLLVMINWKEDGLWDLYRFWKSAYSRVRILQPVRFTSPRLNRLSVKLSEFYLPVIALFFRGQYDVVISWTMRIGVNYGLLNRLIPFGRRPHLMYDLHINPTRDDPAYRLRLALMRLALPGINFFMTTSGQEAGRYPAMFGFDPRDIRFFPMAPAAHFLDDYPFAVKDYVLAYGNSDRDYDTLIAAAAGMREPVIILTQNYVPATPPPPHVTILTRRHEGMDLIELVYSARLVVLPLKDERVSAGQTAMLEIMALGRPLVVTANPATREYAEDGESALYCRAKDTAQLAALIRLLIDDRERAETLGRAARQRMRRLVEESPRINAEIIEDVYARFSCG